MSYKNLIDLETLVIALVLTTAALVWLLRRLEAGRPGLSIRRPLYVGYVLRIAVVAGVSATGIGTQLRGGDEGTYLAAAHQIAATPWFSGPWAPMFSHASTNNLYAIVFAIQIKGLGFGAGALRITQIGISLAGLLAIVAAAYDLGGPRAARLTAWLAVLEPSNVFFSGTLLKEPLLDLAIGLVILGAAHVWRRFDLSGLLLMGGGCLIAVFDRGYIGIFLIAASLLMLLHVSARNLRRRVQAVPVLLGVLLVGALLSPTVIRLSSPASLKSLIQVAQNANTLVTPAPSVASEVGKPNGNNLALEPVNFSSRTNIILHLPQRIRDLLLKPYPWQVSDWSQRLGAIGSLIALALLLVLIRYAWIRRGAVVRWTGPLLYPTLMLLIAFSLAVGNAGTGFRYRAHLVTPAFAMLSILWARSRVTAVARQARLRARTSHGPRAVVPSGRPSSVTPAVGGEA